jgi:SAM-dependent methyltransferase
MSVKRKLQQDVLQAISKIPFLLKLLEQPGIRGALKKVPVVRALYPEGWDKPHPYDMAHAIDAGGYVDIAELGSCHPGVASSQPYCASQPSILRAALKLLPRVESSTFIDLGCGKGRPLFVASEFPFRDILGIELSPSLADTARKNARTVASRFPERTTVRIEEGDATTNPFPAGDLVLFLYHPFSSESVSTLLGRIERELAEGRRSVFVVYYNPVHGEAFDASSALARRFAGMIPCSPEELGYGADSQEAVIIWQGANASRPSQSADARIVITKPGLHAVLEC